MLVPTTELSLSRVVWLGVILFSLMLNALLCWTIIYVSVSQDELKVDRTVSIRLSAAPKTSESFEETVMSATSDSAPRVFEQLSPPLVVNTLTALDVSSQIVIPDIPIERELANLSIFNPMSLQGLERLESTVSPPILMTSPSLQIAPLYPSAALARNIEGTVVLEFSVDGQGKPYAIQVINENPSGYFKQATLKAFTRWRFPVESNRERDARYQYTVTYKIDK